MELLTSPTPKNSISRNPHFWWIKGFLGKLDPEREEKKQVRLFSFQICPQFVMNSTFFFFLCPINTLCLFHKRLHMNGKRSSLIKSTWCLLVSASYSSHRIHSFLFFLLVWSKSEPWWPTTGGWIPRNTASVWYVLRPELQCFISDYQLTRDAALHHGP